MRRTAVKIVAAAAIAAAATAGTVGTAATAKISTAGTGTGTAKTGTAKTGTAKTTADGLSLNLYYIHRVSVDDPYTTAQCQAQFQISCYDPDQVAQAYNLTGLFAKGVTGKGRTIVLVDVYGSPTVNDDLAQFDSFLGLQAPTSFKIIQPVGKVPAYDPHNGDMVAWASETTLDVEYAHAAAPGARILLVEVPGQNPQQIMNAELYVIKHKLGDVISQSFGWTEQTLGAAFVHRVHSVYAAAARAGITVLASSGDTGAASTKADGVTYYTYPTASWPATDPSVTAVGGTELNLNASGERAGKDTAWNDTYSRAVNDLLFGSDGPNPIATGGGRSAYFSRPSYQDKVRQYTGAKRGLPDVSMSGSCAAAVNVYQTFSGVQGGWYPVCGTSESSPLFAGIVALAAQEAGHRLGDINPALYRLAAGHAPGLVPVTSGNNTVSFRQGGKSYTVRGYDARNGFSLTAGVGTVNARYFVPELARLG